jgi:hypothetical protein
VLRTPTGPPGGSRKNLAIRARLYLYGYQYIMPTAFHFHFPFFHFSFVTFPFSLSPFHFSFFTFHFSLFIFCVSRLEGREAVAKP